jgi:hypothetical protein
MSLGDGPPMRSLDSISFDTQGLTPQGDDGNQRNWLTPEGDRVTLYHFVKPSPKGATPKHLEYWREKARESCARGGGALIEAELTTVDGRAMIRDITKVPQLPSGMGYLGCLSMPFRDFGYLIAVACRERGITGMRDTAIFAELMQKGEVRLEEGAELAEGWMQDPYDPSRKVPPGRNRSEDEIYDDRFPDHPLSQLRRLVRQIETTLRLSDEVRSEPSAE